ncbi:MAG: beta-galactosidase [Clostridia bacterium]|nr:beta-galactosidase [Clostridia bacterium]
MYIPRPEYPRPTLVRGEESWVNLNGTWEFQFDFGKSGRERGMWAAPKYEKEILVPFVPESKLSGIEYVDFIPACWYRRTITIPEGWDKTAGRVLLNFGAVDYSCVIYVNGKETGTLLPEGKEYTRDFTHKGGFTPFTVDITDKLVDGENTLVVYVEDDGKSSLQPTGKQVYYSYYNRGCHYTRCTGIWQTVWMEYVPNNYVKTIKITPDIDAGKIDVVVSLEGANSGVKTVTAEASFAGEAVSAVTAPVLGKYAQFSMPIPDAKLWSLDEPNLYDLTVCAGEDKVASYFGMRSVAINGYAIEINHKPVYQRLVLDQGYFMDGIYAPLNDADLARDIELSKAVGFNGARMHMKVFEPRFLYYADKMGYLLWDEFPNWGLDESNPASLLSILPEWLTEMERDYNHPSVIGWCPFNETGARRNKEVFKCVYQATRAIDPMRPIIDTSGYVHVKTDIYDVHNYDQNPETFKKSFEALETGIGQPFLNNRNEELYEGQPYFVSEFGGAKWVIDEEPAPLKENELKNDWGYGQNPEDIEAFYTRFKGLVDVLLDNPKMCAFCYTQLTDVYQEQNGIYAFDRRAKFDAARLHAIMSRPAAIEVQE